jgi:hypothetical protein
MATASFDFGTPQIPNAIDGEALYVLGCKFQVSETVSCVGIEWFVPLTAPAADVTFSLWAVSGETQLRTKVVTIHPVDDVGELTQFLFDSPIELSPSTDYLASVHTSRYTATSLYVFPQTDGLLTANASNGWYVGWGTVVYPNNVSEFANNYHVSPIIEVDAPVPSPRAKRQLEVGKSIPYLDPDLGRWRTTKILEVVDQDNLVLGYTDSSRYASADAITYVGIGAAAAADNASVSPALPAGINGQDLVLCLASIRDVVDGVVVVPTGWKNILTLGNMTLMGRFAKVGEAAPVVSCTGGAAGDTVLAQCFAFRGMSKLLNSIVAASATQANANTNQNIDVPSLTIPGTGILTLAMGWKAQTWTSVNQLTGQFFTEISEATSTLGNDASHVIDYRIQTSALNFTGTFFTVTGGAVGDSKSMIIGLKPDGTAVGNRSRAVVNGGMPVARRTSGTQTNVWREY